MPILKTVKLVDGTAEFDFDLPSLLGLTFKGIYNPDIAIQFYGPIRDRVSMANVGISMFNVLRGYFDNIAIHNYCDGGWIEPGLKQYAFINQKAPIGIFYGVPDHVDESFFQHRFKIGGFVCETDRVSTYWVGVCNKMDLVFVPSNWCKAAFCRSGVTVPIMVVPHGLEPEFRPYKEKIRTSPFTFYNTFRAGSLGSRKGMEELIKSFITAFYGRKDVVLRLRTELSPALEIFRNQYEFGDLIKIDLFDDLGTKDFAKIFSDVHCTVHPSKGEGFGLIPFESIACETPVIAPHTTGMLDYLTDENSISLKTNGREAGEITGNALGTYFGIDENHLVQRLKYVFKNWESEYQKVKSIGPDFRKRNTWKSALTEFVAIIKILLDGDDIQRTRKIIADRIC